MSIFGSILKGAVGAGVGFVTGGPAGAVAGGVSGLAGGLAGDASAKAVKGAAATQLAASQAQIAAAKENRDYQYNLNAPTITRGQGAGDLIAGFLGLPGGSTTAGQALDTFRGSTGYKDLLDTALRGVSANAYARGAGGSGAALKALQDRAGMVANQSAQGWLGNLFNLEGAGRSAAGLVAGVGGSTVGAVNQSSQAGADATGNAALVNASNNTAGWQNLLNMGASLYGSSYGKSSPSYGSLPGIY